MTTTPFWRRYARFFGPDPAADVNEELRFHLESKTEELIRQGWICALYSGLDSGSARRPRGAGEWEITGLTWCTTYVIPSARWAAIQPSRLFPC